jgi:hypothetical protein
MLHSILQKQRHLFGNLTAYDDVLRLEPGSIIEDGRTRRYFDYSSRPFHPDDFHENLSRSIRLFNKRKRILPLSGGLDSRLLLAHGRFDCGYTFGPEDSGDRPVARRFRGSFDDYKEFSLLEILHHTRFRHAGEAIFDGLVDHPFVELISVYSYLHDAFGEGCIFFDGYAGDVFQRGAYLAYGGVTGYLAKIFPAVTTSRFDPIRVLRCRYNGLDSGEQNDLISEFVQRSDSWDMDPSRRFVLFELLYGRGSRYTVNNGAAMFGQFFTPYHPYLVPDVFRLLFGLDPLESLTLGNLSRIWAGIPNELTDVPTTSGYKPLWAPWRSRFMKAGVKGLGKLGVYNRAVTYERELKDVVWGSPEPRFPRAEVTTRTKD